MHVYVKVRFDVSKSVAAMIQAKADTGFEIVPTPAPGIYSAISETICDIDGSILLSNNDGAAGQVVDMYEFLEKNAIACARRVEYQCRLVVDESPAPTTPMAFLKQVIHQAEALRYLGLNYNKREYMASATTVQQLSDLLDNEKAEIRFKMVPEIAILPNDYAIQHTCAPIQVRDSLNGARDLDWSYKRACGLMRNALYVYREQMASEAARHAVKSGSALAA